MLQQTSSNVSPGAALDIFQLCKQLLSSLRNVTTCHQNPRLICSIHQARLNVYVVSVTY